MSADLVTLPPLPEIVEADAPLPPTRDDGDPIACMVENLKFFVSQGRALADAIAAIGSDPTRGDERKALGRQYLACVDRAQSIACDLAPYKAPRMATAQYQPPPKPTPSEFIPETMSARSGGSLSSGYEGSAMINSKRTSYSAHRRSMRHAPDSTQRHALCTFQRCPAMTPWR
jgi:hypothetical protein